MDIWATFVGFASAIADILAGLRSDHVRLAGLVAT